MLALACVVCINSSGEDWVLTSAVQQSLNHHYPSTIHLATKRTLQVTQATTLKLRLYIKIIDIFTFNLAMHCTILYVD